MGREREEEREGGRERGCFSLLSGVLSSHVLNIARLRTTIGERNKRGYKKGWMSRWIKQRDLVEVTEWFKIYERSLFIRAFSLSLLHLIDSLYKKKIDKLIRNHLRLFLHFQIKISQLALNLPIIEFYNSVEGGDPATGSNKFSRRGVRGEQAGWYDSSVKHA